MDARQQLKTIEQFIDSFGAFESGERCFDLRDDDGVPWWDIVRYDVQFALCVERGIYRYQVPAPSTRRAQARSFVRQSGRLAHDVGTLRSREARRLKTLLVSSRTLPLLDRLLDEDADAGRAALIVGGVARARPPHATIAAQSVALFTRLDANLIRVPADIAQTMQRLAQTLAVRFGSQRDLTAVMARKYRAHLSANWAWSFVLRRLPAIDRVVYVNDDTLKTLVFLARRHGVATVEVQHGYMGRSHVAYSYPPVQHTLETLPDKLLVCRDTGDIVYPVPQVFVSTPGLTVRSGPREIDVLVGASPTLREETEAIVRAVVGRGFRVAVKLHPAQTAESSGLRESFSPSDFAIHDGRDDFCALARRASIYIPANPTSTTTFEAVEQGARLIIVDFGGTKKTSMNDHIVSARLSNVEALHELVHANLDADDGSPGAARNAP